MKFGLFACLLWMISFRTVRNSNYCREMSCDFVQNAKFRLDKATSHYFAISELSRSVVDCANFMEGVFNPSIDETLRELDSLYVSIESFKWEDESQDVPEILIRQFEIQKEANKNLEERYDKLLRETERVINRLSTLTNKVKQRENLMEDIKNNLDDFERTKFNLRQDIDRLINSKMSRTEFNLSKRDIKFQLDTIRTKLLLIEKSGEYDLTEEITKNDNLRGKLSELSAEVEDFRKSIDHFRTENKKLDGVKNDIEKIRQSLTSDNEQTNKFTKSKLHQNNKYKDKHKQKNKNDALSVADMINAKKGNKKPKG